MKLGWILVSTLVLLSAQSHAETEAEQNARELADTIRTFNAAFGGAVDGELTPEQIDEYERLVTPIVDVDQQHKFLCGLSAQNSVMQAGLLLSLASPQMADQRADIANGIVPGSLNDWMVQISQPLLLPLGPDRAFAVANNECLKRPIEYVMNVDTPMGQIN